MAATGTETESAHLRRALELAEGGRGRVSPNPLVGAVLVDPGGEVIGEGFHAELGRPARRARRARGLPRAGRRPRGRDPLRDARALRPQRPPAAVHRGDPRGGHRARRLRLRGPDREGVGPRARDAPRRRRRGRAGDRRRDRRRAAAEPALPQARPHRPPAGHLQGGDDPGRPRGGAGRRLALDLGRPEPRAGAPLARGVRRDRGRDRHRARPTTRC